MAVAATKRRYERGRIGRVALIPQPEPGAPLSPAAGSSSTTSTASVPHGGSDTASGSFGTSPSTQITVAHGQQHACAPRVQGAAWSSTDSETSAFLDSIRSVPPFGITKPRETEVADDDDGDKSKHAAVTPVCRRPMLGSARHGTPTGGGYAGGSARAESRAYTRFAFNAFNTAHRAVAWISASSCVRSVRVPK